MKKSKKLTTRLITNFLKSYFPNFIYPHYLFLKTFKNFKRKTTNPKQFDKFSNNLDQINQNEFKITSQNNEDGIIEYIFNIVPNNKHFVEIGFGYYEFNSLNLIKKGWEGKLIDTNIDIYNKEKKNGLIFFHSTSTVMITGF